MRLDFLSREVVQTNMFLLSLIKLYNAFKYRVRQSKDTTDLCVMSKQQNNNFENNANNNRNMT